MTYVALGDSISIDLYTGVEGGGAASQFARLIKATRFIDLTYDGAVTSGVLTSLESAPERADIVTVTAGGNDLLSGYFFRAAGDRNAGRWFTEEMGANLERIAEGLKRFGGRVVMNTIYDPTDGDDSKAAELGLPKESRIAFNETNAMIKRLAEQHGYILCDLEALFRGHGFWSQDPWMVVHIEPNLEGAKQIAQRWFQLVSEA
jgi:lysophospholipase L1-like esterase